MRHIVASAAVLTFGTFAAHPGWAATAQADATAQALPAVVQDRDQPARNPYQEYARVRPPTGSSFFYTVAFSKVPGGRRRVIEHVSCLIIEAPPISFVFLSTEAGRPERDYLPWTSAPVGSKSNVIINVNTDAYFFYNDRPMISFYGATFGDFDCTAVGYDVSIP